MRRSGRWAHVEPRRRHGAAGALPARCTLMLAACKGAHRAIGRIHGLFRRPRGLVAASPARLPTMAPRWAALALAALFLCSASLGVAAEAEEQAGDTLASGGGGEAVAPADDAAAGSPAPAKRPAFIALRHQDSWVLEGLALALLATFLVNLYFGRKRNEQLALAWTAEVRRRAPCLAVGSLCRAAGASCTIHKPRTCLLGPPATWRWRWRGPRLPAARCPPAAQPGLPGAPPPADGGA